MRWDVLAEGTVRGGVLALLVEIMRFGGAAAAETGRLGRAAAGEGDTSPRLRSASPFL